MFGVIRYITKQAAVFIISPYLLLWHTIVHKVTISIITLEEWRSQQFLPQVTPAVQLNPKEKSINN